jgi:hypothetical protein
VESPLLKLLNIVSLGGEISRTVESSGADGLGLPGEVEESLEHEIRQAMQIRQTNVDFMILLQSVYSKNNSIKK